MLQWRRQGREDAPVAAPGSGGCSSGGARVGRMFQWRRQGREDAPVAAPGWDGCSSGGARVGRCSSGGARVGRMLQWRRQTDRCSPVGVWLDIEVDCGGGELAMGSNPRGRAANDGAARQGAVSGRQRALLL